MHFLLVFSECCLFPLVCFVFLRFQFQFQLCLGMQFRVFHFSLLFFSCFKRITLCHKASFFYTLQACKKGSFFLCAKMKERNFFFFSRIHKWRKRRYCIYFPNWKMGLTTLMRFMIFRVANHEIFHSGWHWQWGI